MAIDANGGCSMPPDSLEFKAFNLGSDWMMENQDAKEADI